MMVITPGRFTSLGVIYIKHIYLGVIKANSCSFFSMQYFYLKALNILDSTIGSLFLFIYNKPVNVE